MPAGATYEPIAKTTGTGSNATITFNSISASYTDLIIVANVLSSTADYLYMRFNGDTATNYSTTYIKGTGSAASSSRFSSQTWIAPGALTIGFSTTIPMFSKISVFNYAGSTNKTILSESSFDNNGSGDVTRAVGLWRSTSAITSITLYSDSGSFSTSSTFALYGIKAA